jgi:xylulose-5-phosphate/fructose-6-phosphate phosphoketolase
VPRLKDISAHVREELKNKLIEHRQYIRTHGEDLPEIRNWQWSAAPGVVDQPTPQAPQGRV